VNLDVLGAGMPARLGGRLCLDFANTVEFRSSDHAVDYVGSYADLVAWSVQAEIVDQTEAELLLAEAVRRPAAATATFAWAMTVREAMYLAFAAVAAGRQPVASDLDTLNIALSAALSQAKVAVAPAGFAWTWERHEGALDQVLWPICRSALELLTSKDVHRVKDCGRHGGCGWLFVDASKNGSRRWCSMQVCGRQEKVRRRLELRVSQRTQ
jgi:predicted RNA-binding Zn ribbon-like protein